MNPTIEKFGYPGTLIQESDHWLVLLRPAQVTLGSLVLAAKSEALAFASLPREAFAELADVIAAIETALARFACYERINYLMLMMVDPNVHFHVIPRYSKLHSWNRLEFADAGWPGPPKLDSAIKLDSEQLAMLVTDVSANFR
jgi:diadenosine tetraphosphate (Ap4A) HIT family hydrolase